MKMSIAYWLMAGLWIYGGILLTNDLLDFLFCFIVSLMFFLGYLVMQMLESKHENIRRELEHAKFALIIKSLEEIKEAIEKKAPKRKK